jgi:hypothetical protein
LPAGRSDEVSYAIRIGDIRNREVRGHAADLGVTWTGDATAGYTLHVDGQFTTVHFDQEDQSTSSCVVGACGTSTTKAGYEASLFEVDTPMWNQNYTYVNNRPTADQNDYADTWIMTGAQYRTAPELGRTTTPPTWQITVGNVHLTTDGQPVAESVTAHVGAPLLAALGLTTTQALALGLDVTRTDGSTTSNVPAAISDAGDGGIYIRIPTLTFSKPRLTFKAGGRNVIIAPDRPRLVTARPLDGAATVRFQPPVFDGGAPIVSYDVRCVSGAQAHTASARSAVAVDVVGLTNGTTYQCSARAANRKHTSAWTSPVAVTPQNGIPPNHPGAIQAMHATPTRAGGLAIGWVAPASTGGAAIAGYQVDVCRSTSPCPAHPALTTKLKATARSLTVARGRLPVGRYRVVVRARNAVGLGDAAQTVARMVLPAPKVEAPALSTSRSARPQVRISWSAPRHVHYPRSTRFTATYVAIGGRSKSLVRHSTAHNATLHGKPGTSYQVLVSAVDPTGGASVATVVTTTIPRDQPRSAKHWQRHKSKKFFNGSLLASARRGATLVSHGHGKRIVVIGARSSTTGRFRVRIDHGHWSAPISTHAKSAKVRQVLWKSKRLHAGRHTITIKVVGRGSVDIDAFGFMP